MAPSPVLFPADRKLRFRVEDRNGLKSATWTVIGHKNTDDVYIGLRVRMHEVKLSLHRSTWRLAFTQQAAQHLASDSDRLLTRWSPTESLGSGWRRGGTVAVPTSSLATHEDEDAMGGRVSVYPAPPSGFGLRFDVLLGDSNHGDLTVNGAIGEVGRMHFTSGAVCWVVAIEVPVDALYEQGLQRLRSIEAAGSQAYSAPRGWAWGCSDDDDGPVLIDLGVVASGNAFETVP